MTFEATLPLRAVNTQNVREHWAKRASRAKQHRQTAVTLLRAGAAPKTLPCVVTVTRVAPRALDGHDGLPASLKAVVDGVADWLGINDNDPRLTVRYDQARGRPHEYAVRVRIEPKEA